jgi:MFS family permease
MRTAGRSGALRRMTAGREGLATRRAPPAWRPGDREFLSLVVFSHGVQHVYNAALPLVYPFVVAEFGISYAALGLVLGVAGIAGGLLQGAAGLFEHASARKLLAAQNLLLAAASVLGGIAPGFAVFGAARCAGAVFASPQHPVGSAVLSQRFPERRASVLSLHTIGGSLGTLSVPLLAGFLIAHWGWRASLFVFAVPMALGGLLLAWRLQDGHGVGGAEIRRAAAALPLRKVMFRRATLAVIAASTIAAGGRGLGVLNAYVPAYLKSDLGYAPVAVGLVFSVLLAGSIIGPVAAGWIADRTSRRRVIWISYIVGAAAITGFGLIGAHIAALLVLGALIGIFAYAESPLLQSLYADVVHGTADRAAFGVYFAIAYGVGSLWVAALGKIIDAAGFRAAFLVMAASFLVAAFTLLFVPAESETAA